jgi:hypothetical protein
VIALTRFRFSGYCRSLRVLHPLIAEFLLIAIMFTTPLGADPRQGVLNAFADVAALTFPIFAWAARGLLDNEPDTQRHLSAVAAGRARSVLSGLVAAFACNVCIAVVALALPVERGLTNTVGASVMVGGVALMLASALAATTVGALTSRAVMPSSGASILVLLGGCGAILLASLGPLQVISVPMVPWMRAAEQGPGTFGNALPLLLVQIVTWSLVACGVYGYLRRTRP